MLDLSTVSEFSDSPGKPRTFSGAAAGTSASAQHQTSGDSNPLSATHTAKNAVFRQITVSVEHNDAALSSAYASSITMVQCQAYLLQVSLSNTHKCSFWHDEAL